MKSFIYAIVFLVLSFGASLSLSLFSYRSFDWMVVGIATMVGFLVGRVSQLQSELHQLRADFAKDWEARQKQVPVVTKVADNVDKVVPVAKSVPIDPVIKKVGLPASEQVDSGQTPPTYHRIKSEPNSIDKVKALVLDYFTGGNMIVRIGILILFFGVSFLLKYASDQGVFPIEYRLMSVAAGAIGLLAFGWYLRNSKQAYGLLLQGAGIGILYLDVFAALSLYGLLPQLPAFTLMLRCMQNIYPINQP